MNRLYILIAGTDLHAALAHSGSFLAAQAQFRLSQREEKRLAWWFRTMPQAGEWVSFKVVTNSESIGEKTKRDHIC